jgi:hypothetical protein
MIDWKDIEPLCLEYGLTMLDEFNKKIVTEKFYEAYAQELANMVEQEDMPKDGHSIALWSYYGTCQAIRKMLPELSEEDADILGFAVSWYLNKDEHTKEMYLKICEKLGMTPSFL